VHQQRSSGAAAAQQWCSSSAAAAQQRRSGGATLAPDRLTHSAALLSGAGAPARRAGALLTLFGARLSIALIKSYARTAHAQCSRTRARSGERTQVQQCQKQCALTYMCLWTALAACAPASTFQDHWWSRRARERTASASAALLSAGGGCFATEYLHGTQFCRPLSQCVVTIRLLACKRHTLPN